MSNSTSLCLEDVSRGDACWVEPVSNDNFIDETIYHHSILAGNLIMKKDMAVYALFSRQ